MTAIYIRVSTEYQTTDMQLFDIKRYCEFNNISNYKIFEDNCSAIAKKRPAFEDLVERVKRHEIKRIIVWRLDRMFRSIKQLSSHMELFTKHEVNLISLKENIDLTTATGRLLINILGSVAQFEREVTAERVKSGMAVAKAKGRIPGPARILNRDTIKALHLAGKDVKEIAGTLRCSRRMVYKVLKAG